MGSSTIKILQCQAFLKIHIDRDALFALLNAAAYSGNRPIQDYGFDVVIPNPVECFYRLSECIGHKMNSGLFWKNAASVETLNASFSKSKNTYPISFLQSANINGVEKMIDPRVRAHRAREVSFPFHGAGT
ncbi:hypothetical protein WA026_003119 [Henosepilachna vigintioctopunctata]|uniref:Uncharacterized protein n=1 Tax=Henosepilachna vigintioctopunctata TaxID=420089 RepID=A0AAW1TM72_9CUCU